MTGARLWARRGQPRPRLGGRRGVGLVWVGVLLSEKTQITPLDIYFVPSGRDSPGG